MAGDAAGARPRRSGVQVVTKAGLVALAVAVLAALPRATTAADPFDINVITPLTGFGAFLGKSENLSLGVAEEILNKSGGINGRPVHFAVQDDQTNPQVAVQLLSGVLAKNGPVVMGSTLTAICGAMAPLVKNGPVLWCFSGAYHPANDWIFISGESSDDLVAGSVRFMREKGWRRIATIASNDASGTDAEHALDDGLAARGNAGMSVVTRGHFNLTDISVAAQIAQIRTSGAQAIYAMTSGAAFGTILHGIADAGLELPVFSTSANATVAQMTAYASFLPKEMYFASTAGSSPETLPPGPVARAVADYERALSSHGVQPDTGTNQAWDAAFIIVSAFRKLGTNASATAVRAYIDGLRGFAGTNGVYDFRAYPQHGVGANWSGIQRWDAAKGHFVGASKPGGVPL
jgi:branched-chain amino acid transport system substrate-binding protein